MTDPRKLLEAKKAQILAAAQKQAQEIDRDLGDLDRITKKYGLKLEEADIVAMAPVPAKKVVYGAARGNPQSVTARSKAESEKLIRELGRPVPLGELFEKITAKGVKIGGKTPKWQLSAYLGQHPPLRSTPRGWWLVNTPLPPEKEAASAQPSGQLPLQ